MLKGRKKIKPISQKKPEARDIDWEKRLHKNERPKRPLCFPYFGHEVWLQYSKKKTNHTVHKEKKMY